MVDETHRYEIRLSIFMAHTSAETFSFITIVIVHYDGVDILNFVDRGKYKNDSSAVARR